MKRTVAGEVILGPAVDCRADNEPPLPIPEVRDDSWREGRRKRDEECRERLKKGEKRGGLMEGEKKSSRL